MDVICLNVVLIAGVVALGGPLIVVVVRMHHTLRHEMLIHRSLNHHVLRLNRASVLLIVAVVAKSSLLNVLVVQG